MSTPLDEALAEARKTLALCDVLDAPASSETRAKWLRIEAALLRAQRIEAFATDLMQGWNEAINCPVCLNDGCSDVDEENEHDPDEACAKLAALLEAP